MSKRATPDIRLRFAEEKNGSRRVVRPTRFVIMYLNQFGVLQVAAQNPGPALRFVSRRLRRLLDGPESEVFQSGVWFEDSPPGEG